MSSANTIIIKGTGVRCERVANAAITPGHLVELMSTDKVRVHATAGGVAQSAFAVEDELQGRDIDTAYAADAKVQFNVFRKGDVVNALISNGEDIDIGDKLVSAGDGTLKEATADSSAVETEEYVVAIAVEACDMSDSSAADDPRCNVEII